MQGGGLPPAGARSHGAGGKASDRKAAAGSAGFEIVLEWPDYVIREKASDKQWKVPAVEAHLLSVIDGKRPIPQLIDETLARIRLRCRGRPSVTNRDVKSAFLRLSMGDLLTDRGGRVTISPKYAPIAAGSLGGAIAVLLARETNSPVIKN